MQKEVIDLSIPGQISRYDKSGYKRLLFSVKLILFGDEHIRMTKERCEKFFEDDNNFEIDIISRQWLSSIWHWKDEAQKISRW